MKPAIWFCVPAHGRIDLARICLTQLRRTIDLLEHEGIRASAVVVSDDENLDTARDLGFGTVERDNRFLGVRFNDALQLACDPQFNPHPADYAIPCGSDDWLDHRLFLDLPHHRTMVGWQRLAVVREDGQELSVKDVTYTGGTGIRIWPARILRELGYRPCDEDRTRGCDTSILYNLQRALRFTIEHRYLHDYAIVDWKSPGAQLNTYESLGRFHASTQADPYSVLEEFYPAGALADMRGLYASRMEMVA
jgi:hypothetical protein